MSDCKPRYKMKQSLSDRIFDIICNSFLVFFVVIVFYPVYFVVVVESYLAIELASFANRAI